MTRIAVAVLAAVLLIDGCAKLGGGPANGRTNVWTHPHVLTIAAADVKTLNPHLGQFAQIGYFSSLTMAYLIKSDPHNMPAAELATEIPSVANGGVSKDGRTIRYHLRKGVTWSDGAPFDADDVVFSTRVVLNPANNELSRQGWAEITKIDEPNKYTVVYHLKKADSSFVETFFSTLVSNPCILPKHLLSKYPNINEAPYNDLPVGIGPFKYERWDRDQDVVMVANPRYFRGRPKLDEIIFKILPDRNTMLAQMQSHAIDMWVTVPGSYLDRLPAIPGVRIVQTPSYEWYHLDFNLTNPALKDATVRRALRLAYNRKDVLYKNQHGLGVLSESPTPLNAPYRVSEPLVEYNPTLASALLDKAGWNRGADGVREKHGTRLDLRYAVYSGAPDVDDALELLRQDWRKIGVALSIKHYPLPIFFAPPAQGGIVYDARKWDVTGFAWRNDAIGDYSGLYGCDFPPNGQDDPRWCNHIAFSAMKDLEGQYDQRRRNSDVKRFVDELYRDVPVIVVVQREDLYAVNSDLKNFHPNSIAPFDNFMNVDI